MIYCTEIYNTLIQLEFKDTKAILSILPNERTLLLGDKIDDMLGSDGEVEEIKLRSSNLNKIIIRHDCSPKALINLINEACLSVLL